MYEHVVRFRQAIDSKLNTTTESTDKIPFSHAVYCKLFSGRRQYLYSRHFSREYFTSGWDQSYTQHVGVVETLHSGSRVLFPIVACLYSSSSRKHYFCKHEGQYSRKSLVVIEMLRIFFNKEECD